MAMLNLCVPGVSGMLGGMKMRWTDLGDFYVAFDGGKRGRDFKERMDNALIDFKQKGGMDGVATLVVEVTPRKWYVVIAGEVVNDRTYAGINADKIYLAAIRQIRQYNAGRAIEELGKDVANILRPSKKRKGGGKRRK